MVRSPCLVAFALVATACQPLLAGEDDAGDGALPDSGTLVVTDSGTVIQDAGEDGGTADDGGVAAAVDAGPDAGVDAGPDGGIDAGSDADAGLDAGGLDAGNDAGLLSVDSGCSFTDDFAAEGLSPATSWQVLGGGVDPAPLAPRPGWAGLQPRVSNRPYSLGRVGRVPSAGCIVQNQEVTFRVELPAASSQGVGVYLRQNGGSLAPDGSPLGAGYAVFLEGFRARRFGLWREVNGTEVELLSVNGGPLPTGVWEARFRVETVDAGITRLRGRVWSSGLPEPTTWAEAYDLTPALQGPGGLAVDVFSSVLPLPDGGSPGGVQPVWFDQLSLHEL